MDNFLCSSFNVNYWAVVFKGRRKNENRRICMESSLQRNKVEIASKCHARKQKPLYKKGPFHCYKATERGSLMSDRIGEGHKK